MKRTLLLSLLLVLATSMSAQTTTIDPPFGFSFTETHVRILGQDLVNDEVHCDSQCSGATCAVHVLFGDQEGDVDLASKNVITVLAPPQREGTVVDVTIKAPGRADRVIPGFRYVDNQIAGPEDYDAYLIPLLRSVAGANGSFWQVEQQIFNGNSFSFAVPATTCAPNVSPCVSPDILGAQQMQTLYFTVPSDRTEGVFLYLPKDEDENVTAQLRVRNTSNGDTNWGSEIPVVPTSDFRTRVYLLDVPTDARFRATLRIYANSGPVPVHIRVLLPNQAQPVEERDINRDPPDRQAPTMRSTTAPTGAVSSAARWC